MAADPDRYAKETKAVSTRRRRWLRFPGLVIVLSLGFAMIGASPARAAGPAGESTAPYEDVALRAR
jgi:hypothetical protein